MSAVGTVARLTKPRMRGLQIASVKFHLIVSSCVSIAGSLAYKVIVCDARKAKYAEFYKNYDAEKEFEEMRQKGIFTSC